MDNGGTAFYRQGARIAVLLADRIARDMEPPPAGLARYRSTSAGNRVAWSIVWSTREPVDTRRPTLSAAEPVTPPGLTSRARARHAIDSYEQDLRRAVQWYIPDDLSPERVYGRTLCDRRALTPYQAIKSVLPRLVGGSTTVVIGTGGLGHVAIQLLRQLTPTRVIALDIGQDKLVFAKDNGARGVRVQR